MMIKAQDILLMLKLISLKVADKEKRLQINDVPVCGAGLYEAGHAGPGWHDRDVALADEASEERSVRSLAASLGISKSEVSAGLRRAMDVRLVVPLRDSNGYDVNSRALLGIIEHALPYFFPARLGAVVQGIPTAYAAPVVTGRLLGLSDLPPVWPDPHGAEKGQAVEPLYRSVPLAVRRDIRLYGYLALIDSVRLGAPRERAVAMELLRGMLRE